MAATFKVDADRIEGSVTFRPLFALADYTGDASPRAFSLDEQRPILYYQRAAEVSGSLAIDGRAVALAVTDMSLTPDASGLFAGATVTVGDGRALEVRSVARPAGFWCPMGWERTGPTLSAYDEFCALRTGEGEQGFGVIEQGILRRLY